MWRMSFLGPWNKPQELWNINKGPRILVEDLPLFKIPHLIHLLLPQRGKETKGINVKRPREKDSARLEMIKDMSVDREGRNDWRLRISTFESPLNAKKRGAVKYRYSPHNHPSPQIDRLLVTNYCEMWPRTARIKELKFVVILEIITWFNSFPILHYSPPVHQLMQRKGEYI